MKNQIPSILSSNYRPKDYSEFMHHNSLKEGIIDFASSIDDDEVVRMRRNLKEVERLRPESSPKEVTINITSPGGSAYAALAMFDLLRSYGRKGWKVTGFISGYAASAASMFLLQACDERVSAPHARFMVHEASKFSFGVEKASDLADQNKEMQAIMDEAISIIATRCGKTPLEVKEKLERRETWMSATEALEWGLIDRIDA